MGLSKHLLSIETHSSRHSHHEISFLEIMNSVNKLFSYQPAALESGKDSFKGVAIQGLGTSEGPTLPMLGQVQRIGINEQLM